MYINNYISTGKTIFPQLFTMIQLLAFFSCLAVIWGGAVPIGTQERIIGGRNTSISELPHQVVLYYNNRFSCGGSILTPKYILTTAQCILYNGTYSIRAGSSKVNEDGVVITAANTYPHPFFNVYDKDFDVGIIELSTPLKFTDKIQPVKLVSSVPSDGEMVKVSGWGRTNLIGPLSDWLQSVDIPMVNKEKCVKDYQDVAQITTRMICAGEVGKSPCLGDNGGPLTYKGQLAGISSFGDNCGEGNIPEVFTNVVDPDIRDFIKKYVPID